MSKKNQLSQCYYWVNQVDFRRSSKQQKPLLRFVWAGSMFLMLAASTITDLPGSKLLAQNVVSQDLETATLYQQGVTRYNRQDFQGAEFAFRQALQRDSNIGMARNYLGHIYLQQNRLDAAVQEYGEAIRLNPNFSVAYYNLGLALHRQGQKEAAITAYRQSLVIDPKMAVAQYNLGLVLYEQGQPQEAIAAYRQAIELDSTNANAYFNLAIALQEQGEIKQAIATYRQVLTRDPNNAIAYTNLGSLMVIEYQPDEAISVYQQAIRQNPKNALAYYNLGVTLYNQGEIKKANVALKRARQEYHEQGNVRQTEKTEQLISQVVQQIAAQQQKTSPPSQIPTPTTNVVLQPQPQQSNQMELPANTVVNNSQESKVKGQGSRAN
ncbi:MAG: tetratricopeptide repeat protein [Gloeotrichia echinulata IR180]|jgi:tetratricopeptide (TPR) repeat protein|nr:tetratricopeptide repeat protein [Gloeotrichia echinulata DEX184]